MEPATPDASFAKKLRKASVAERREMLANQYLESFGSGERQDMLEFSGANNPRLLDFCDLMVEQSIGAIPVPLGIASGFLIDGRHYHIPMATEEPSVIAAASFAASRISHYGGFKTRADAPLMDAQIFLEGFASPAADSIAIAMIDAASDSLRDALSPLLASMVQRGGGFHSIQADSLGHGMGIKVTVRINVCDAMGANLLNSCAETLRAPLERITGGKVLMAILSNQAEARMAEARFSLPVDDCARAGFSGVEAARRIIAACAIANTDPSRAVTHNKGVMNGISALTLACGNDTRAIEACAHAWAAHTGQYRSLTSYWIEAGPEGDELKGSIELPASFGTVGGACGIHPVARMSLALLGNPRAQQLSRIAAAVGLAQNFAALSALTAEGIQQGHMKLHERRLAWRNKAL